MLVLKVVVSLTCILLVYAKHCDKCYIYTPLIRNGLAYHARLLSTVNPEPFLGIQSHSGYITVNDKFNSNLFFWFFPVAEMWKKPWIIWLQGGPGISSLIGLFDLIGPIKVEDGEVKLRNVTWTSDYSVLFLDNPVGAGFSFTDDDRGYPNNENDIGAQLYEFVQQFLQMFPELRKAPLFIAGESYAGKYVPALAIQLHRNRNATCPVNLKGISIGNGLIDPRSMMHYSDLCKALGILEGDELVTLAELEQSVVRLIDEANVVEASNKFNETIEYIKEYSGVSIYNFLKNPDNKPFEFEEFIKRAEVRELIHVENASFNLNNQLVYEKMLPDIMNTTLPWVNELLEHYGVLCYSGQLDIILPYSLSKYTYDLLRWPEWQQYVHAKRKILRSPANGDTIGYQKSGGNFVEVLIRGAGHKVPADQPEVLKYIIDTFIQEFK